MAFSIWTSRLITAAPWSTRSRFCPDRPGGCVLSEFWQALMSMWTSTSSFGGADRYFLGGRVSRLTARLRGPMTRASTATLAGVTSPTRFQWRRPLHGQTTICRADLRIEGYRRPRQACFRRLLQRRGAAATLRYLQGSRRQPGGREDLSRTGAEWPRQAPIVVHARQGLRQRICHRSDAGITLPGNFPAWLGFLNRRSLGK